MTPEEAILGLEERKRLDPRFWEPHSTDDLQLGIEAQKAWIEGRQKHGWFYFPLLPGETED